MVLLANRLALEGMNFLIGHANDRSVRRLNQACRFIGRRAFDENRTRWVANRDQ